MFYLSARSKPIAQSAKGIYITADDGKSYMDAASGAIVCQLGHSHPKIIEAIKKQVLELQFSYRTQFENQPAIDLANMIVEKTNSELDRVFFVSGGSEAVESAMKLIRQYHFANGDESRSVFISRVPSYHGCTMGVLALTGYEPLNRPFIPMFQLYPKVKSPTQYRIPDGMTQEEYGLVCANEVETAILETGIENVAGFVAEPIGGASSGAEVPHDIYFPRVQEICKQYNIPIILDEVMTGIGRTGKMFGYNHWNIDADVICLAKGLGAGYYPVAAIVAKDKFVQLMDMARESASLTENEQTEQNKIYGCTSQAWVVAEAAADGTYQFRTDSDALIVKGLLNILERIFNGHSSTEIRSVNGNRVLDSVGLGGSISSQRTNGFASAIQKIKEIAV